MDAIIVTDGTVEEIAALVLAVQERHGSKVMDSLETMWEAVDSAMANEHMPWELPLWAQAVLGGLAITAGELAAGVVLNLWLGLPGEILFHIQKILDCVQKVNR